MLTISRLSLSAYCSICGYVTVVVTDEGVGGARNRIDFRLSVALIKFYFSKSSSIASKSTIIVDATARWHRSCLVWYMEYCEHDRNKWLALFSATALAEHEAAPATRVARPVYTTELATADN